MHNKVAKFYDKFYFNKKYYFPMFHEQKKNKIKSNSSILKTWKF